MQRDLVAFKSMIYINAIKQNETSISMGSVSTDKLQGKLIPITQKTLKAKRTLGFGN